MYEQCRSSPSLSPLTCMATELADRSHKAKQKKSLYSGTIAHMKNIT